MNDLELKTELKIVLWWINGLSACAYHGDCQCGPVFAISRTCLTTPNRKIMLKEAPQWVQDHFPEYDFKTSALKDNNG